jgi:hypothetical protein
VPEGSFDAPFVRTDNNNIVGIVVLALEVSVEHWGCIQVVHWNIKEALDLGGMQIHSQNTIRAGAGDHIGDQFGRDGDAALIFSILPRISKIRNDGSDLGSTGSLATVNHNQQFHQIVVHRRASWLHQEHIATADIVVYFAEIFAVRKLAKGNRPQVQMQEPANVPS